MTKRLSLVASFVLLLAVPAMAQRSTAAIRGVVSDPTNAVVSGAKVSIKNGPGFRGQLVIEYYNRVDLDRRAC